MPCNGLKSLQKAFPSMNARQHQTAIEFALCVKMFMTIMEGIENPSELVKAMTDYVKEA